ELLAITETRVLIILIADTGRVEQHTVDLQFVYEADDLPEFRAKLNALLAQKPLAQVGALLSSFAQSVRPEQRKLATKLVDGIIESVDANRTEKLLLAGTANLVRKEEDFSGSISPVLEHGVGVRIGRENSVLGLSETAVVVSGYENAGSEVAKLGVIGPTRMDYSSNIAAVRAVARYLTKVLGG
ncbi:MAG: hypothetical protein RIS80_1167, partial [Actinomycetota bacterium]